MTEKSYDIPEMIGRRGHSRWDVVIEELISAPGEWFRIEHNLAPKSISPFASRLRNGKHAATKAWPPDTFDVRVRGGEVYARFVGEES